MTGAMDSWVMKLDSSIEEIITRRLKTEMSELTIGLDWLAIFAASAEEDD